MTLTRVAGERIDTLMEALSQIEFEGSRNGMMSFSMELEPRLGTPFMRALMRVEAELLLEDADRFGENDHEVRTNEQRAADALVALAFRVTDATRAP